MTKIVAEIGSNWEPGNLDSALAMVRLAAECRAGLVKFQDWGPLESFDRPDWWKKQSGKWTLPPEWFSVLRAEAGNRGVRFFTSVFTMEAISRVGMFDPIKIASGEIGNQALLLRIPHSPIFSTKLKGHPVYLSVPSTRQARVIPAMTWLNSVEVTLLHCVADDKGETMYPADDVHLTQMDYLREFGLPVGFSSHLPYPQVVEAVKQMDDLAVLELHLRSHETPADCPDNKLHALYPEQFKEVVEVLNG